jgi:hypothetical protein
MAALLAALLAAVSLATCNNVSSVTEPLTNEEKLLNLDRTMLRERLSSLCIAAVVYLNGAQADAAAAPAAGEASTTDPRSLEREVLEALNNYIVGNTKFQVFAAPDDLEKKARGLITGRNANVIPAQQARELAATAGVDCIITVSVETDGKRVNFAIYSGETGRLLYSETLVDWDFHLVQSTTEAGAA